ncbi:MAG: hypothetical protein QNJ78_15475 [Gammaproteobacteria bacterium]|nr:hypothetical protein [Gammaproteobacteria bacterium]
MKTIALGGPLLFFSQVYTGTSAFEVGNADLYAGFVDSQSFPTAVQSGIGDTNASALLRGGIAESPQEVRQGMNDGYASFLLDVGHNID